jgi:hypothetical protein
MTRTWGCTQVSYVYSESDDLILVSAVCHDGISLRLIDMLKIKRISPTMIEDVFIESTLDTQRRLRFNVLIRGHAPELQNNDSQTLAQDPDASMEQPARKKRKLD